MDLLFQRSDNFRQGGLRRKRRRRSNHRIHLGGGGQAGQEVRRRRQEDHRDGYLAWVSDMANKMAKPSKELKAIYCSTQANKDKLLTEFLPSLDDEVGLFC